jgi:hypothetical protein
MSLAKHASRAALWSGMTTTSAAPRTAASTSAGGLADPPAQVVK